MTKTTEKIKEDVVSYDIVKQAYKDTQRGSKKFKKEAILFDMCRERNLVKLWRDLNNNKYEVGEYIRFKVYEPKERVISAPRLVDKIVQFILHYRLVEVYDSIYVKSSFACQKGKGTHKAV